MKNGLLRRNWNALDLGCLLIGGLAILDVSAGWREYHLILLENQRTQVLADAEQMAHQQVWMEPFNVHCTGHQY
jgi:hypothetical protein